MKKVVLVVLIIISILSMEKFCLGQCINVNKAETIKPPKNDGLIEITDLIYSGDYIEMYSKEGDFYTVGSKNSDDYITIRQGVFNGQIIAQGISQITWSSPENGYYYIHYNSDRTCGHDLKKRNVFIENISCPPQEFFWEYLRYAEKIMISNYQLLNQLNKFENNLDFLTFF